MNKVTTNTTIFAAIFGFGFCVAYGLALYVVQEKLAELAIVRENAVEQTLKESAYKTLLNLLEETASDRAELASRFLTERDTVSFISETEQAATQRGLVLETTNLALNEGDEDELDTLLVEFSVEGPEAMVRQYVSLLESLPYHNRISALNLYNQTGSAGWRGEITLHITLIP